MTVQSKSGKYLIVIVISEKHFAPLHSDQDWREYEVVKINKDTQAREKFEYLRIDSV